MKNAIMSILILISIQGCALFETKPVQCKTQIEYSGYSLAITGLDVPVGGQKLFQIGKLDFKPEKVQEAKELSQALDLMQFSDCQFALLVPKEQVIEIRKHREATLAALSDLLKASSNAKTESELQEAINTGKLKQADLQQEAHNQSKATNP